MENKKISPKQRKRLVIYSFYLVFLDIILQVLITPLYSTLCCNLSFRGRPITTLSIHVSDDEIHYPVLFHFIALVDKIF